VVHRSGRIGYYRGDRYRPVPAGQYRHDEWRSGRILDRTLGLALSHPSYPTIIVVQSTRQGWIRRKIMKNTKIETLKAQKDALEQKLAAMNAKIAAAETATKKVEIKVSADVRKKLVGLIEADANRTSVRENGYKWPCFMASKVFYAARSAGKPIDPAAMSDGTALALAKAYGLMK